MIVFENILQHGGRLVKIDDANTNHFIVQTLNSLWWRNNGVWIGLNDRNVEMNWQWIGTLPCKFLLCTPKTVEYLETKFFIIAD